MQEKAHELRVAELEPLPDAVGAGGLVERIDHVQDAEQVRRRDAHQLHLAVDRRHARLVGEGGVRVEHVLAATGAYAGGVQADAHQRVAVAIGDSHLSDDLPAVPADLQLVDQKVRAVEPYVGGERAERGQSAQRDGARGDVVGAAENGCTSKKRARCAGSQRAALTTTPLGRRRLSGSAACVQLFHAEARSLSPARVCRLHRREQPVVE